MTTASVLPKSRITARVTSSVQSMLEEAAAFLGVPLNSFLVSAAMEKAGDVLAKERTIKLTARDSEFLSNLMENSSGAERLSSKGRLRPQIPGG